MIRFIGCENIEANKDTIEIISQGKLIDIHNACEFIEFSFNVSRRELSLLWDYYETERKAKKCEIILEDVIKMEISPRDEEIPFSEDTCLDKMIYNKKKSSIIFHFWGGMKIDCICKVFRFTI